MMFPAFHKKMLVYYYLFRVCNRLAVPHNPHHSPRKKSLQETKTNKDQKKKHERNDNLMFPLNVL